MITSQQFLAIEAQYVVFTPALQMSVHKLVESLGPLFDGSPVVLPFGVDIPPEIPRLIFSSADKQRRIQISGARADFYVKSQIAEEIDLGEATSLANVVLGRYLEITRAVVGRLAFVLKRTVFNDTPGIELAKHFCRDQWLTGPLNRPADFELHAHKKYRLTGRWNVNSWMRCKTGMIASLNKSVILVEQDLNTSSEEIETAEFGAADINDFFQDCRPEVNHILKLYFPGGNRA
jgi:hypothetical protein